MKPTKPKTCCLFFFILSMAIYGKVNAQSTNSDFAPGAGLGHLYSGVGDFVGWTNSAGPLNFQNSGTTYIQLSTAGLIGIGTATIPPFFQLDVSGEINIGSPTNYYMIGGQTVLHNFGNGNIFTGVGSGNFTLSTAAANSCYGTDAGASLTTGISNTFLGSDAGALNQNGNYIYFEN